MSVRNGALARAMGLRDRAWARVRVAYAWRVYGAPYEDERARDMHVRALVFWARVGSLCKRLGGE